MANCSAPPIQQCPIGELQGTYKGQGFHDGGWYGGGLNHPTAPHHQLIVNAANAVEPLDQAGQPAPMVAGGRVVLLAMGFSDARMTFKELEPAIATATNPAPRAELVTVNGAYPGKDASDWADPNDFVWTTHVPGVLAVEGVTAQQVQVAWLLTGLRATLNPYPQHVTDLADLLATIARNAKASFPNLKLLYIDSIQAQHYLAPGMSPDAEPTFFEQGFAVREVIQRQLAGDPTLNPVAAAGAVVAPVLDWGGRLWCDGATPDARGHAWLCPADVLPDGHHPSTAGAKKLAALVLGRWTGEAQNVRWFAGAPAGEQPGGGPPPPTQGAG